jgi:NAD(P)-dependent dehydrogenase (short-subunit alcohol dehydrogenase family)
MSSKSCIIVGAGPGNGLAFGRRFAEAGYRIALLARTEKRLQQLAAQVEGATAQVCDVTSAPSVQRAFAAVRGAVGDPDVLIYNADAGTGTFGNVDAVTAEDMEAAWRSSALGCFLCAREVLPGLRAKQCGSIVIIGATASLKGSAGFIAFASAKAALRSVAQSLARQLGPEGIHVAHVVIDGVIDLETTRRQLPTHPDEFFLKPADIAESVFRLVEQPRSAGRSSSTCGRSAKSGDERSRTVMMRSLKTGTAGLT